MEEKRKALMRFCTNHDACFDCPLGYEGHKCGAGYSFRCRVTEPGYIPDAEVEEMYKIAFPEKADSPKIKPIAGFCEKCTNKKTCAIDEGFMEGCVYTGTSIPSLWEMDKTVKQEEKPSPREEILREAIKCVCSDRNQQYGEPEDNFDVIAGFWEKYLGCTVTARMVADMMILLKIGRAVTADVQKKDTYIDIAGYAACAGGMIENG